MIASAAAGCKRLSGRRAGQLGHGHEAVGCSNCDVAIVCAKAAQPRVL